MIGIYWNERCSSEPGAQKAARHGGRKQTQRTLRGSKERRRVCLSLFVYRGVDAIRRNEERERRATGAESTATTTESTRVRVIGSFKESGILCRCSSNGAAGGPESKADGAAVPSFIVAGPHERRQWRYLTSGARLPPAVASVPGAGVTRRPFGSVGVC